MSSTLINCSKAGFLLILTALCLRAVGVKHYVVIYLGIIGIFLPLTILSIFACLSLLSYFYHSCASNDYRRGNFRSAYTNLSSAIRLDSQNANAYLFRGVVSYEDGDFQGAIVDLNSAVKCRPNLYQAFYYRGLCYYGQKAEGSAFADFDHVISINPSYELAYFQRGTLHLAAYRYAEAIENFHKSFNLISIAFTLMRNEDLRWLIGGNKNLHWLIFHTVFD